MIIDVGDTYVLSRYDAAIFRYLAILAISASYYDKSFNMIAIYNRLSNSKDHDCDQELQRFELAIHGPAPLDMQRHRSMSIYIRFDQCF